MAAFRRRWTWRARAPRPTLAVVVPVAVAGTLSSGCGSFTGYAHIWRKPHRVNFTFRWKPSS